MVLLLVWSCCALVLWVLAGGDVVEGKSFGQSVYSMVVLTSPNVFRARIAVRTVLYVA